VDDASSAAFVDDLLAAPAGVALLARLEAEHRADVRWFEAPPDSDPVAVDRAAAWVAEASFGALVALTLEAAESLAGPWVGGAPDSMAAAFRHASPRRAIAATIAARHGDRLRAPLDRGAQQWWHSDTSGGRGFDRPRFRAFDHVYGNGEFPWDGLWTTTDPPSEAHDGLLSAWEVLPGPVSRWHLAVRPAARVWTIDGPDDWVGLVTTHPKVAAHPHGGWELPGPNQHDVDDLLAVPGQSAARRRTGPHVLPDWAAVAADHDGVHLSWAGFLTTEGRVCDLPGGGVTMLRYWGGERTLWLADAFGAVAPAVAPALSGSIDGAMGVDARTDAARQHRDRQVLTALLGR